MKNWMVFSVLGFEIIGLIIAGIFLGEWLDTNRGWGGIGITSGVLGALVLWLIHVFVLLKRFSKDDKDTSS